MSFSGYSLQELAQYSTIVPPSTLSLLIMGSASDGPLGDIRYFTDIESVLYCYGGHSVARVNPAPTDTSETLASSFIPDDPTLTIRPLPLVYNFPSGSVYAVDYPYLFNLSGSAALPDTIYFDAIGDNLTTTPASGGIFIQSEALYTLTNKNVLSANGQGVPNGDVLLPLAAAVLEGNPFPVAAMRMGASWLPFGPPIVNVPVANGAMLTIYADNIGDNTANDLYVTPSIIVAGDSFQVDPGNLGLPYVRRVYPYANYSSWSQLLYDFNQDCIQGFLPFNLVSITGSVCLSGAAQSSTLNTYSPMYMSYGTTPPNLTTASGWVYVLQQEGVPGEEYGFICLSGLSGLAMSNDLPNSVIVMEALFASMNVQNLGGGQLPLPILVVPWSLTPPPSGVVYNPASDIMAAQSLYNALGTLANNLLIIWGTGYINELPTYPGTNVVPIPVAYSAITAILRESLVQDPLYNPLRPNIKSLSDNGAPYFYTGLLSEPPLGVYATATPSPSGLAAMLQNGITALTRAIGRFWTLYTPITLLDGSTLYPRLTVLFVEEVLNENMLPFIGQPNTQENRDTIQGVLTSISQTLIDGPSPFASAIAQLQLTLLPDLDYSSYLTNLYIQGQMQLYGEVEALSFQVNLSS